MAHWTLLEPLDLSTLDFFDGDRPNSPDDLFESLDEALQLLEVLWDLLHILSYYNPLTDDWDTEGLLDYLYEEFDWFEGSAGGDTFSGRGGNDVLHGNGGIDTAVYEGTQARYALARQADGFTVTDGQGGAGRDTLAGIERLRFDDRSLALDLDGHAGGVARLIGTLFGPQKVADAGLVGLGLQLLDGGLTDTELAQAAVASALFADAAGSHSNADFVRQVYRNVTGQEASVSEQQHYTALLDSGATDQAALALWASQTELLAQRIDLVGLAEHGLGFMPPA
ncbi:DUF4214 domain-containing protein [Aquincola sp. S2]|uniref:DUF4214 domain-containing protein n=1 Tax=Pseudaquabacterium terrae TaxID=2732868 RepID=A0ABX2EKK8_9BURK|nr:DUF4214 domain-containing protein [Aquabacterium terrae]NRF69101.1 DUF4214 domain-containing protein [Aquabacterium terrae]